MVWGDFEIPFVSHSLLKAMYACVCSYIYHSFSPFALTKQKREKKKNPRHYF